MRIVGRETLHRGAKFSFAAHDLESSAGDCLRREFVAHPGSVVLLPVLDDGRLVFIRNYRHTLDRVLLELPAGTRNPGEPPLAAAARELAEETGYRAESLTVVFEFYPAPGLTDERMTVVRADRLTPGDPQWEPDEEMKVEKWTPTDVRTLAAEGRIV
ncbi:MAG: NUDIX hydrolase, partial [Planctomycetia bacterium]